MKFELVMLVSERLILSTTYSRHCLLSLPYLKLISACSIVTNEAKENKHPSHHNKLARIFRISAISLCTHPNATSTIFSYLMAILNPIFISNTKHPSISTARSSPLLHLLHLLGSSVQATVYRGCHSQRSPNDGTNANEEGGEGFRAGFAVDDFHR